MQDIPSPAHFQGLNRLKYLRIFIGNGYAFNSNSLWHCHNLRHVLRLFDRKGQVGTRSDPWVQFIAHRATQLQYRESFRGRIHEPFISDPFLVESQHLHHRSPTIQKGDRRVIAMACGQFRQGSRAILLVRGACLSMQQGQHALEAVIMPSNAIG